MTSRRTERTDAELVRLTLSGNRESFSVLVRRYQAPLLQLAISRLGKPELAEEAVQDAFASAYRSLQTYRPDFSFRTWLWTILLNQCKRKYKRLQNSPPTTPLQGEADCSEMALHDADHPTPLQLAITNERSERIGRMLNSLPEAQGRAVRLRFFAGMQYQEIADTMDCGLSTAKMRVRVGLEKLSAMLSAGEARSSLVGDSDR